MKRLICSIAMAGLLVGASLARAVGLAVVVPNAQTAVEGDSDGEIPFSCFAASSRYQQVYLGSEVGSGVITEIRFRQDGVTGTTFGPSTFRDITITLSSTTKSPDDLSLTFAANVGADVTTVFSGDLTLSSASSTAVPRPFDVVIPLQTAFAFDASDGLNLLLDMTIPACSLCTVLDTELNMTDAILRDSVSRIYSHDATSPMADFTDTVGLVTEFGVTESVESVVIDIKPGAFPNSINPNSKAEIPVAILTTQSFDATTVDPMSVGFGSHGTLSVRSQIVDVDGDGDLDLLLFFKTQGTGIACGDSSASLAGNTFSGRTISGSDSIRTVGCKAPAVCGNGRVEDGEECDPPGSNLHS